jgi:maltose-binding protein MalE
MKEFFAKNPWDHIAAEQMQYVRSNPVSHADGEVWTGLDKLLEKIEVEPKTNVAAALKELHAKINQAVAESRGQ